MDSIDFTLDQERSVKEEPFADIITRSQQNGLFLLHIIKTGFNMEDLVRDCQALVSRYSIRSTPRADGSTLRSISLTHRPNAEEPVYDGNNTQFDPKTNARLFEERDFSIFNNEMKHTVFYEIYKSMPFKVGRMRLNLLTPLTVFAMHRDSAPRAHIAIVTNPYCFLACGSGEGYHIPADGNVYVFDTTAPHTAYNASNIDRFHLTMSLA